MIKKGWSRPKTEILGGWLTIVFLPVLLLVFAGGCASLQTAETTFEYELPDGRKLTYASSKDHSGIDVEVSEIDPTSGKVIKKWKIKVEKSGTPQAAYAALARQQDSLANLMKAFVPLVEKAISAAPGF